LSVNFGDTHFERLLQIGKCRRQRLLSSSFVFVFVGCRRFRFVRGRCRSHASIIDKNDSSRDRFHENRFCKTIIAVVIIITISNVSYFAKCGAYIALIRCRSDLYLFVTKTKKTKT
jgi:hypothetical protein